ncbi:MAG: hypothetical protein OXF28_00165 [Thaumarchaeota archaeon]|nr:hypothetical protein [Nitrososphaerota archaeon]MCY3975536.1 hypothetical protein [Nitrososphaerota archaeon]
MDMEASQIADKIIRMSKFVRIVTVCDMNGKLVYSARPKSIQNKLTSKESTKSLTMAAESWKSRKELSRKLGKCKYVIAEYEKVKRITMPAGKNHILYVTAETNIDHNKLIGKISKL